MRCALRNLLCAILGLAWTSTASLGRPPAASSHQFLSGGQSSSDGQSPSQAPSQTQAPAPDKQGSVAEAARKAKEKKGGAAKGKIFTEDDLSSLKGSVSVVGTENTKQSQRTPAKTDQSVDALSGEAYWRGQAQPILQEMAEIDQLIAQLREDIKKYGTGGVDVATGMKTGVAYVEDRNGQIQKLQKKKADLQKKLDDLEEEGRKAGAEPAWFR